MSVDRRSFRAGLVAGLFLFAGLIGGVVLSSRLGWMPTAGSADQPRLPLPASAGPQQNFVPVVKAVTPAVVNISTTRVVRAGGAVHGRSVLSAVLRG